ncbi:MAG: MFS transporter [Eubacteriaceae bacterium]|nr:MFS transporter [Eubacteriaceae bacterium]
MINIKKQIYSILTISVLSRFLIAGSAWVALLSQRGFSMVEIGIVESVFHVASFCFEIPSGIISDVFGRKKSMILSQCMFILSAVLMIFSESLWGICLSIVFDAFGYNFSSGSREALAYDSLKVSGHEDRYRDFASTDLSVYRISNAASLLCAGLALILGYRTAYIIDIIVLSVCLMVSSGLKEVSVEDDQFEGTISQRLIDTTKESILFLVSNRKSIGTMLFNSLIGAFQTLILFFLQARLPLCGLDDRLFGPALFFMTLGGAVGAKLASKTEHITYRKTGYICAVITLICFGMSLIVFPPVMILAGFTVNIAGDLFYVCTDEELNRQFPSSQRATLVSVSSLCFSVVMMIMSPLFGFIFS